MFLSVILVGVVATVVAAPAAQAGVSAAAASCNDLWLTPNGEGAGIINGNYNLKSAPYAACSNVRSVNSNTTVYFWCWWVNDYGNKWWYVRVAGTSTYGWMVEGHIGIVWHDDNGDGNLVYQQCSLF
jgi:hypothetical protein